MKQIRLSFVRTVFEGVHTVRYHSGAIVRLLVPLVVVSAAFSGYFQQLSFDEPLSGRSVGILTLLALAWTYVGTCTLLGLYRQFLSDRVTPMEHGPYRWSNTHWRLLGWGVALWVLLALVVIIPLAIAAGVSRWIGAEQQSIVSQLLQAPAMLVGYYFYGRWVLVLPMVLMKRASPGLTRAWDLTEGNGLHMLLCVGLLPTVQTVIWAFLPAEPGWGMALFGSVLTSLFMAAEVVLVSRAVLRIFAFLDQEAGGGGAPTE